MKRKCKICKKSIVGRSDKIFCTVACKNEYNLKLRRVTTKFARKTDNILHRNRSILLEIMGKAKSKIKIDQFALDQKGFNYNYITGYSVNKQNKMYHHVYDFSYMVFSNREVLIVRKPDQDFSK